MIQAVRDTLLCHAPVSLARASAYAAAVVVMAWLMAGHAVRPGGTVLKDEHAATSLELALVRAYCGVPSSYSGSTRIVNAIRADASLRHVPFTTLIDQLAGSKAEYCRNADQPFVNNENSLLLIESAVLRAWPGASLSDLGQALHALRLAGLAMFALMVLSVGGSVLLALGAVLCGLLTLDAMPDFVFSAYPFLFVLVLLLVSAYAFALRFQWTDRVPGAAAFGLLAGFASSLTVNMRTSYLPVAAALLVIFLAGRWWLVRPAVRTSQVKLSAVLAAGFVAGYVAFQAGLITRHVPADRTDRVSHSIAHPLVLALGVPETPFGRELGIRWNDEVGPQKAMSVDPEAEYLSPRYHQALMEYYRRLWAEHPGRMFELYRTKFAVSGSNMLELLRGSPGSTGAALSVLLAPLDWISRVAWLVVTELVIAGVAAFVFVRRRSSAAFAIAALALAAALLQAEAGIVYSLFVRQYHNYSAFFVMFISMVGWQLVANAAWSIAGRPGAARAGGRQ